MAPSDSKRYKPALVKVAGYARRINWTEQQTVPGSDFLQCVICESGMHAASSPFSRFDLGTEIVAYSVVVLKEVGKPLYPRPSLNSIDRDSTESPAIT